MPAYDRNNIFARILRGELPCTKVYEDEFALAFHDIHPQAPVHVLVIPKGEYVSQTDFCANGAAGLIAGFWRAVDQGRASSSGCSRTAIASVANDGPSGGQVVFHFHVHIFERPARPRMGSRRGDAQE